MINLSLTPSYIELLVVGVEGVVWVCGRMSYGCLGLPLKWCSICCGS